MGRILGGRGLHAQIRADPAARRKVSQLSDPRGRSNSSTSSRDRVSAPETTGPNAMCPESVPADSTSARIPHDAPHLNHILTVQFGGKPQKSKGASAL